MASQSEDVLILDSAHSSKQGVRPTLEDHLTDLSDFQVPNSKCTSGYHALYAVFDGHGNDSVAKACVQYLPKILSKCLEGFDNIEEALNECIISLDATILKNVESSNKAGAVTVIALIDTKQKKMWVVNVGDSRCIMISQRETNNVEALSKEHRPESEELDRIKKAGGFVGPRGYVMNVLAMTRVIGDGDVKQVNPNVIISTPDILYRQLTIYDKYLILGCDGLWDVLSNEDVENYLLQHIVSKPDITLKEICSNLTTDAIKKYKSMDNVSVIIVKLHELN